MVRLASSAGSLLPLTIALGLSALAGCDLGRPGSQPAEARPNIVLLLTDDLGYADLGVHGSRQIATPHIDSLARQGVRFSNAYVTSPVCGPSRAGLLTGRYPQRLGVYRNRDDLPAGAVTIASILREAGYATGIVGKWHLGEGDLGPLARGFEEYTGFHHLAPGYERAVGEFLPHHFTREAVSFIERHAAERFFLYVAFSAPHAPVHAPGEYLDRFAAIDDPVRRAYAAMVSALDDATGKILAALDEHDVDRRTLVIFVNDNGGAGRNSRAKAANASINAPLRGFKQDLYEGGIRVPLLIRWPDWIPADRVLDAPVSTMDLFPTIAAVAGVELPAAIQLDGVDLMPHLAGEADAPIHPQLFWTHHDASAVRRGSWKLVDAGERSELFDLATDPGERIDLARRHPEVVRELSRALASWRSDVERSRGAL